MVFHFVYVLQSMKDKGFYVGFTDNLGKRKLEHDEGKNKSTASRRTLQLIFYEAYLNKYDALRRERYFKSAKGKAVLKLMLREHLSTQGN